MFHGTSGSTAPLSLLSSFVPDVTVSVVPSAFAEGEDGAGELMIGTVGVEDAGQLPFECARG